MGILNRFFDKKQAADPVQDERRRKISSDPIVSAEQQQANRTLMESQLADARSKRESPGTTPTQEG